MALIYRTELAPSKLELLAGWAPKQSWFEGEGDAVLTTVASFRFDDPAGQVGVETLLVRAGDGPLMQIPLTYRNERLTGADEWLIGTMEHGVLGTRWTYDAVGDPVYRGELARAILTGGTQVELWIEIDGVMTRREPTARVWGTGSAAAPIPGDIELQVIRVPTDEDHDGLALLGTWADHPEPAILATASAR